MEAKEKKFRSFGWRNVITWVIALLLSAWIWYVGLPALTPRSLGFWFAVAITAMILGIALIPKYDYSREKMGNKIPMIVCLVVMIISILIIPLIAVFSSLKTFHYEEYRKIPKINKGAVFEQDFPEIKDGNQVPIVDVSTAKQLGDRTVGNLPNAPWYEVNEEYNLIMYHGKAYRVSPLMYADFIKYHKAKNQGIPGYVLVDAQTKKAVFVKVEGGFFYSPSAYFEKNLHRRLRKQFKGAFFGKSHFEPDEEGKPFWITAVNKPTVGLCSGMIENSFIITNAVTGESVEYKTEELPEWVDHAISLGYIMDKVYNYYDLIHGAWNWSDRDVYRTTYEYREKADDEHEEFAGYNSCIDSKGQVCFYTGLTPANKAESNAGFLLISCRTGEIHQYLFDGRKDVTDPLPEEEEHKGGIEESSAIERAETTFSDYRYMATFPLMVNVANEPTYLICLKGKDGLVHKISLVLVSTEASTVVTADSIGEAVTLYKKALVKDGVLDENKVEIEEKEKVKTFSKERKLEAIYEINVDGTTHFLYKLKGDENLYDSSIKTGYHQVSLEVGDKVIVTFIPSKEDVINVSSIKKK